MELATKKARLDISALEGKVPSSLRLTVCLNGPVLIRCTLCNISCTLVKVGAKSASERIVITIILLYGWDESSENIRLGCA